MTTSSRMGSRRQASSEKHDASRASPARRAASVPKSMASTYERASSSRRLTNVPVASEGGT